VEKLVSARTAAAAALAVFMGVAPAVFGAPPDAAPAAATGPGASSLAKQLLTQPTAEQIRVLEEERTADLELFVRRAADFREVVDSTVRSVYEMRKVAIEAKYKGRIEIEEELELEALKEAIRYFEEFLKKYPDDLPYTPDAMFRLAELYYDVSYIEFLEKNASYNAAYEAGTLGADEEPPVKEFDRTIALFCDLIRRYPDYANVDGAYYLLGYCLNDTGNEEEARLAWLNLVCENKYKYDPIAFAESKGKGGLGQPARPSESLATSAPAAPDAGFVDPFAGCAPIKGDSRFFFEAWWLVGQYHFDYDISKYGVETAIAAYKKLVEDPSHRFYDRGLYKLAWSYFKVDMFPESIHMFSQLVDYSDEHATKGTGMRPEAILYLAFCFYSDDWNGDQTPDPVAPFSRLKDPSLMPQDRKWTREVYARLGDLYAENEKQEQAIEVWRIFLEKWPLDVQAPFVQDKIADAYREMRKFDIELAERSKLDGYGKGSAWWAANEDHPEAQNQVATMSQDALYNAALSHHQNAQALRAKGQAAGDEQILGFALEEYNLAAAAYKKYIEQNPDTPDAYDLNFWLADTLFWTGRYQAAKAEYIKVRDSNLDDRHREEAAHFTILCIEAIMKEETAAGRLSIRTEPPPLEGTPPLPEKIQMPPLLLELMAERANYMKYIPGAPQASTFDYQSARSYHQYGYWDEAKPRYETIYDKYCKKDEVSFESWKILLNMAVDQNDLDEKERLALLEQERQCGVEGAKLSDDGSIDLGSLLGDVAMQRAMDKFNECKDGKEANTCSEAGDQLVAAVAKAPRHPQADGALNNAAVSYEFAQRFESAMGMYGRIINEYPESQWVDKCLYRQAFAANNFFEYEKALDNYKILADAEKFKKSEYREDAVYNSAYILTNLQSYAEAVPYWQRYSKEVDDEKKSVEAAFNAADMPYRAGSLAAAVTSYEGFIARFERSSEAGAFVVKAAYRLAEVQGRRNKKREQIKGWERTVELYKRLVNQPGSMSAEYAAQSHFLLIEEDMREFEKFEIKGNEKAIKAKNLEGAEKVKDFERRYREIAEYRRPEWSLAAEYRIGFVNEVYAKAILNTPIPTLDDMMKMLGLSKAEVRLIKSMPPEELEDYQFQIEDKMRSRLEEMVAPVEAKAQAEYKIAIDLARKGNISNEWTLAALERMNAYDPDNYPRQHNGIVQQGSDMFAVPPWAGEVK
jgi:tetratricopeptide (TPR) repeat protein